MRTPAYIEIVRSRNLQRITGGGGNPMNRVRDVLTRQRIGLPAASAGFALDLGTAEVLPPLLDAIDRAHDLRNCVTAARLAMDLMKRQGAIPNTRAGRLLESSLRKLRDGIEDTLLDEALSAGGLRTSSVRLAPVLAHAHSAASELGADDKSVTVLLQPPRTGLSVRADPRLVGPAVRGLLRAALQVARQGATIRVRAVAARDKARVAVAVNGCRKLPGNRLPDLPALALARRAARAQGGSLSARVGPDEACEFRLALPRIQPH